MKIEKNLIALFLLFCSLLPLASQDWLEYIPESDNNYFVLVIDRSGSMSGTPLQDAKAAAEEFIEQMNPDDYASIISFESKVHLDRDFTNNKESLVAAIDALQPGGMTALYDAVAKAAQILRGKQGSRVILFLTDGNDNESSFSLRNLRRMNIGESVLVYGIGLGDINHSSIQDIAESTKGIYKRADQSADLISIYHELQAHHYSLDRSGLGGLTVTSLPNGIPVMIDGVEVGRTPLMLSSLPVGEIDLELMFNMKTWQQQFEIREKERALVRGRESDLLPDLIIETAPLNSAVFVDDAYIGLSAMTPSNGSDHSNQLRIENIAPGKHNVKIIAVPNADLGTAQVYEFEIDLRKMTAYMNVAVFMKKATITYSNGTTVEIKSNPMSGIQDRLNQFDSIFGN